MARAWTNGVFAGCWMAIVACTVSVNDGPIDDIDGMSGGSSSSGSSGSSAAGTGGSAGAAGQGGDAGSMSIGNGGEGGSDSVPTPVCTAEAGDDQDPCLACIKEQCCTQWQACDDAGCQQEREDIVECVSMLETPDVDSYGECVSMYSYDMTGLPQVNTEDVLSCVNEVVMEGDAGFPTTRCGTACFGIDIFFD